MRGRTQADIASYLGVSAARVSQMRVSSGWWDDAWKAADGWDLDAIGRAYLAATPGAKLGDGKSRKDVERVEVEAPPRNPVGRPRLVREPEPPPVLPLAELIRSGSAGLDAPVAVLRDPDASPLDKAKAAMAIAAVELAESAKLGAIPPKTLEGLERAMRELRRSEADYLQLLERRRELVPYSVAEEACAHALVVAGQEAEALCGVLGPRVVQWLGDPSFVERPTADQVRIVYQWADDQWRGIRSMTSEGLMARVADGA